MPADMVGSVAADMRNSSKYSNRISFVGVALLFDELR
jgi:hypothetical protein